MKELHLTEDDGENIITVTKAVSSSTRYNILKILSREELDISRLAERLDQTEANVSAQVKQLEKAELVESRYEPGDHGVRKICKTAITKISIEINSGPGSQDQNSL